MATRPAHTMKLWRFTHTATGETFTVFADEAGAQRALKKVVDRDGDVWQLEEYDPFGGKLEDVT